MEQSVLRHFPSQSGLQETDDLNQSTKAAPPYHLSSDILYPLIVLAGFTFFVSLVTLPPNDFWWHLKIGEIIANTRQVPAANIFSWVLPANHPFVYGAWLGELLLYLGYWSGGLTLLTFARNILISLVFFLMGSEAKRISGSWRLAALTIGISALMTVNNLVIRPQIWAWLPFALFFILLNRYSDDELKPFWLISTLPLLMIFWVNVHGSFILGGVMVGIFFVGELMIAAKSNQRVNWLHKPAWLLVTGALCGLGMLVNPRGLGSLNYMVGLLTDTPSQRLIMEWQSPTPEGIANVVFYTSILILFAVVAYSSKRLKITELLLLLSFIWLAWTGMRYILWFGLILIPILARQVSGLPTPKLPLVTQTNILNTILAVTVFLPAVIVQPWFVNQLPLPAKFTDQIWVDAPEGPLVTVETPIYAAQYLKAHPGGKLFNEMGYGSYLIWAIPDQKVFIDPRVELYPLAQWEDYIQIEKGHHYGDLLAKYGADRVLLDKKLESGLSGELANDSRWVLEYSDRQSEIWRKK